MGGSGFNFPLNQSIELVFLPCSGVVIEFQIYPDLCMNILLGFRHGMHDYTTLYDIHMIKILTIYIHITYIYYIYQIVGDFPFPSSIMSVPLDIPMIIAHIWYNQRLTCLLVIPKLRCLQSAQPVSSFASLEKDAPATLFWQGLVNVP